MNIQCIFGHFLLMGVSQPLSIMGGLVIKSHVDRCGSESLL